MIAFIKHAEQSRGALRCTAVPLLLSPYLLLKGLIVSVCWFAWYTEVLTPTPFFSSLSPLPSLPFLYPHPPFFFLLFLLSFSADEIKDDFDTLGPDTTLQAVGNGTGESTEDVECVLFFLFFLWKRGWISVRCSLFLFLVLSSLLPN